MPIESVNVADLLREPQIDFSQFQGKYLRVTGFGLNPEDVYYRLEDSLGRGNNGITFLVQRVNSEGNPIAGLTNYVLKLPRMNVANKSLKGNSATDLLKSLFERFDAEANRGEADYYEWDKTRRFLTDSDYASYLIAIGSVDVSIGNHSFKVVATVQTDARKDSATGSISFSSLESWQASAEASDTRWLPTALSVAKAIADTHHRRVIHNDIWPPNVFVSKDQKKARLIDFGQSWISDAPGSEFNPKLWQNPYAAPEVVRGAINRTEAVDVYAFGVLLYWLMVGSKVSVAEKEFIAQHLATTYDSLQNAIGAVCTLQDPDDIACEKAFLFGGDLDWNEAQTLGFCLPSNSTSGSSAGLADDALRQRMTTSSSYLNCVKEKDSALDKVVQRLFWAKKVVFDDLRRIMHSQRVSDSFSIGPITDEEVFERLNLLCKASTEIQKLFGDGVDGKQASWYFVLDRAKKIFENRLNDPGIPQNLPSNRAFELRQKVRQQISTKKQDVLQSHPWVVDLIVGCCHPDPARRPRMPDVLRQLGDYCRLSNDDDKPTSPVKFNDIRVAAISGLDSLKGYLDDGSLLGHVLSYRISLLADISGQRALTTSGSDLHDFYQFPGSLEHRMVDIFESRDVLIDHLCWLLQVLGKNSWLASITTLSVWQRDAMGIDGRYLTANLQALQRGAGIMRVFAVSIEALGDGWWSDFVNSLAFDMLKDAVKDREVSGADLTTIQEELLRGEAGAFNDFVAGTSVKECEIEAFVGLLSAYHAVRRKRYVNDAKLALKDPPFANSGRVYQISVEGRATIRKRIIEVFSAYADAIDCVRPNVLTVQDPPDISGDLSNTVANDGSGLKLNGLFLGLLICEHIDDAMEAYNENTKTILCTTHDNQQRLTMFDIHCEGRHERTFNVFPSLNRIRVFEPGQSSDSAKLSRQIFMDTLRKTVEDTGDQRRLVNIGPLIRRIRKIGEGLLSDRVSSLVSERIGSAYPFTT